MSRLQADKCKIPLAFWRAVERAGISPPVLLRQARLPVTLQGAPDGWVTTAQYFALWRSLEELTADPAIGIRMTLDTDTSVHPPATLSAFFAKDYRDGLLRLQRFKRLCTPEELIVCESPRECAVSLRWIHAGGQEPDAAVDVTFAVLLELGRRGTGRHIVPLRAEMMRAGPVSQDHQDYLGCRITLGAPRNALVLAQSDLDRPFPGHNPEVLQILNPALSSSLSEIEAQSSLNEQIKLALKRQLASGKPELGDIARELGMSERTLQRRITDSGTTFRKVLEEARRELGRQMLADEANAIDEIAFMLGYQDSSAFYRAFRSWEGVTPARWRELN